jgi:hydroxylamine reductase (hybrid-cluster protein)
MTHVSSAWQNQKLEFAMFPGAILMTSNCKLIFSLKKLRKNQLFTNVNNGQALCSQCEAISTESLRPTLSATKASRFFLKKKKRIHSKNRTLASHEFERLLANGTTDGSCQCETRFCFDIDKLR